MERCATPTGLLAGAILIVTVAAVGPGASGPAVPSVRASIDRVIEAYGGAAALARVHAYRMDGRVVARLQGREGPTTRLFARPDRLRVELRYPDEGELRIVAGSRGWRARDGAPQAVEGPLLDAMVLQAARAAVPWILMDRRDQARPIAPREHDGRHLQGFEIELGPGLALEVWVDPASQRVEISRGRLAHGGMTTDFETVYGDFRKVGGVLFAFREENYASGAHTGHTLIERVELNPRLRPGTFAPPPPKSVEL